MLDAERLHLKAHDPGQVGLCILVIQDGEPQVVVQEVLDLVLALQNTE